MQRNTYNATNMKVCFIQNDKTFVKQAKKNEEQGSKETEERKQQMKKET